MDIKDFDPNGFKFEFRNNEGEITQTFGAKNDVPMSKIKAPRDYGCPDQYIVETTHGYYTDDGYGLCSSHDNLDNAVNSCNYWAEKGDDCRVVHKGFIVYIPADTDTTSEQN